LLLGYIGKKDGGIKTIIHLKRTIRLDYTVIMIMIMMKCACCGGDMKPDRDTGNSIIYKCSECGLSDSRLKEEEGGGGELVAKEEEKEKEEKKSC
jgi:hypothetical protein